MGIVVVASAMLPTRVNGWADSVNVTAGGPGDSTRPEGDILGCLRPRDSMIWGERAPILDVKPRIGSDPVALAVIVRTVLCPRRPY